MTDQSADKVLPVLTDPFLLADWHVDPKLDRISRDGTEIRLEPKVMNVLTLLAAQPGNVLSREEIEAAAWGDVIVGYEALSGSINKLRKALGDDTHKPKYIETVSKKGYRLIAPVSNGTESTPTENPAVQGTNLKHRAVPIAAALFVVAGLVLAMFLNSAMFTDAQPVVSAGKRIAVLPFVNLSKNPKQDYFVEGITDDLITDLSSLSGIVVISRSATAQYKGKEFDPMEVGKQLGANFLLEGSVRKSNKLWRMNVKLINAVDGTNLWAQRYKTTDSELFTAQDDVARKIVEALALQLNSQDEQRLNNRPAVNFKAYELFLQGQKQFKVRTKESNLAAQDLYRQAIKLDPKFARAYGALAVALDVYYWRSWTESPNETLDRALEMAKYATELDPGSPQAYWALGYTYLFHREETKAVAAVDKAVELAPNYADGYGLQALINNYLGNADKAVQQIKKGMQLNPHYTWDYPYNLGRAYYIKGEYQEAIKYLNQALDRNENARNPRMFLVASYMAAGQKDDAAWEVDKMLINSPETTATHLKADYPISADNNVQKEFFERMRQAGLPE